MISAEHAKYLSEIYKDDVQYETTDSIVEDVLDDINDSIIEEAMKGNKRNQYIFRYLRVDNEVKDRVIKELTILGYNISHLSNDLDYLDIKW